MSQAANLKKEELKNKKAFTPPKIEKHEKLPVITGFSF